MGIAGRQNVGLLKGKASIEFSASFQGNRLTSDCFAVLAIEDIDEPTAQKLVNIHPQAVLNLKNSFTGEYPVRGVFILLQAGIPVVDLLGEETFTRLKSNDEITLDGAGVYLDSVLLGTGRLLDIPYFQALWQEASIYWPANYEMWIQRLDEEGLAEADFWLSDIELPLLVTELFDRSVLVVSQGLYYIEDMQGLKAYISREKPVLVGVEAGADILLNLGYRPDMIIGPLTQVSKKAMTNTVELVVSGPAEELEAGLDRAASIGKKPECFYTTLSAEEAGIFLAYVFGAKLIITVGTRQTLHNRRSPWLQQLTSDRVVSAAGVKNLYPPHWLMKHWLPLLLAGLFPVAALFYCF